jgi:hypothetical protein
MSKIGPEICIVAGYFSCASGGSEIVRRTPRENYVLKELDGTIHAQPYAAFRIITYIC